MRFFSCLFHDGAAPDSKAVHQGCLHGVEDAAKARTEWSYKCDCAADWAALDPKAYAAALGGQQSPIDIPRAAAVAATGTLETAYDDAAATIVNTGHGVQLNWRSGGLTLDGEDFQLQQFHFHAPSEHLVDGRRFPLEMHLMHVSASRAVAVVSVLFEQAPSATPNAFLAQFLGQLPPLEGAGRVDAVEIVSTEMLRLNKQQFFKYAGSLSTPPCTEGCTYMVVDAPQKATAVELAAIMTKSVPNARPVQPLNGRAIELVAPEDLVAAAARSLTQSFADFGAMLA
ncbi:alpha carbonic anhydrase [Pelagophyceae sp. CCMP2097]|nr:alpha carbonic anhydrase [Pelagophyceae sp. CCMP2097]|mmetsp:Transcript_16246/g.55555  ORF Transcript_16246/g.55555 Transcript_16246/m.55555 type:complete len:285 (+) Transcript_16246:60-914(+)